MNLPENVTNTLRRVFDDGLDEVLIFAFIFIAILLAGNENPSGGETFTGGILPIIVIGVFILLYSGLARTENTAENS